ncbi:ArsR/SmtB family transcription factor [Hymenobacter terrenus]|uniref:ArsR/SmtB family transcription factor n=1 Tax=Hymenobacter terrenus TaxID=1629124 RepID=UPI000619D14F|nr:winged helix-turn-helix domain-containing protein [Hymenobacter terrenus]
MDVDTEFTTLTALIGEPTRARMLLQLLDGRALTAGELACHANASPQAASGHLGKLVAAELLAVESQGRHRYYRFARPEVADALEALASLVPTKQQPAPTSGSRYARSCYDHLAGHVAVAITQALCQRELLTLTTAKEFTVTNAGTAWFTDLGIDAKMMQQRSRRAFARPCLDWSERRHHLGGALGAAMLTRLVALDWVRRTANSRLVVFTGEGQRQLYQILGVRL